MGKRLPVVHTPDGTRAVDADGKPINPASVDKYIASKFGASLEEVTAAMTTLAKSMTPAELRAGAFGLYEQFRPGVADGLPGWGTRLIGPLQLVFRVPRRTFGGKRSSSLGALRRRRQSRRHACR
jgi:hypothetical protein